MEKTFKVLIACYDKWDTLAEVPFMFKTAGYEADVFCSSESWLLSNKYHGTWYPSPQNKDDFRNGLMELVKKNNYDWVILGDDLLIRYMNEVVEEDMFKKLMPIVKIENRYMLSSKDGFSEFCAKTEIDTPKFVIYNSKEDLKKVKETLEFPVINKLDFSWGGSNMYVSNSIEELESNLDKIPENQNILIQEFITGVEIHVEALFYQGVLVNFMSSNILQYSKNQFSFTTRKKYFYCKELEPKLKELGEKLGLNAFANILYIYSKERNRYYLIEVDPRPNSWMPYARYGSKHDFIEGIRKIASGAYKNGYPGMRLHGETVEIALFYKDMNRILRQKDIKGFSRWLFNAKGYWRFIPLHDKKLFSRMLKETWGRLKENILKKQ